MKKRIISLILIITTLFSIFVINANAAKDEEYLSEVALVYEDSVEDAKKAIAGTDWKLLEQDLNPNADYMIDDGVYLIYKTSTNVEDAITDLRVMDMYGGYSTSNYENQLAASKKAYEQAIDYLRITMYEFKELYNAGDAMARLAYRQMNYYKDTDTNKLMGDFFLGSPTDDEIVTVLMEGNAYVVTNLITLLAIGISGGSNGTLAERITANYENRDTFINSVEYYNVASMFSDEFAELAVIVKRYNTLADQYNLTDDDVSNEEADFLVNYASVALTLDAIPYGEGTLKDFVVKENLTVQDLCPIIAAFTEGQLALADIGALTTVLQYSSPSKPIEELNKAVEEIEKELTDENGNLKIFDVYMGVDRSIFDGDFAFTTAAERQQAITGMEWTSDNFLNENKEFYVASISLAASGAALVVAPIAYVKIVTAVAKSMLAKGHTWFPYSRVARLSVWLKGGYGKVIAGAGKYFVAVGVGLLVAAIGIAGISLWHGYYNPDYTPIPNTMVDVRETDLGDKYIKYTAAKVYGDEDGRNADFNAYEGKEWIALYYTKDATAGKCLLPTFVCSNNDSSVARRHQGVSMFGESKAFNLNSHVFGKNAPGVYLTVRYSTAKKAAADVPNVVGSLIISGGYYALTAFAGAGVGVGVMALTQFLRKKKGNKIDEEIIPEEASSEN